jgi:AcrR family transcriptional regulator
MVILAEAPQRRRLAEPDRCRILREAAETVFLRDGYVAANMDEVARRAGMSKRTLYQYYPSKAALFEATIEAALAPLHLDSTLEREPDLAVALTGMLVAAARHLLALRQTAIFRLVISEVQRSPELAEAFHRASFAHGTWPLERRIAAEMERGTLDVPGAEDGAKLLYGMALGAVQLKMLLGLRGQPEEAEIAKLARQAVAIFLNGAQVRTAIQ